MPCLHTVQQRNTEQHKPFSSIETRIHRDSGLHDLLELSPRPIISVEYEPRRYFNWFVVKFRRTFSVATKEEDAYVALDFVHDGWLSDVTIPPAKSSRYLGRRRPERYSLLPAALPLSCLRYIHYVEAAKGVVPGYKKERLALSLGPKRETTPTVLQFPQLFSIFHLRTNYVLS